MPRLNSSQVLVARNVVLDGRLGLFHRRERWLAVADLHFGYEISQRAAGNLFPLWGMRTLEARLKELLGDFKPQRLILLGDLVHDATAGNEFFRFVERLRSICEIVLIAGNHDRQIRRQPSNLKDCLVESWQTKNFYFHHGHCTNKHPGLIEVIGHHHPAGTVRDGAGLRLKLPAFVQQKKCWVMPAFSPWAGGSHWTGNGQSRVWLCSPTRILRFDENDVN